MALPYSALLWPWRRRSRSRARHARLKDAACTWRPHRYPEFQRHPAGHLGMGSRRALGCGERGPQPARAGGHLGRGHYWPGQPVEGGVEARGGGAPCLRQPRRTAGVGIPGRIWGSRRRGPAYLGFVEQEPHEGGEQQGGGEWGARPQLLGQGGEGGGRGLLGQGHRVRGAHAAGRAAGSAPRLTLAKGARARTARGNSPDAKAAPGHGSRRPALTAPASQSRVAAAAATSPTRAANRLGPGLRSGRLAAPRRQR